MMTITDLIVVAVIALILGAAAYFVYRSKKSGRKCIGCPDSGKCSGCCSCHNSTEE